MDKYFMIESVKSYITEKNRSEDKPFIKRLIDKLDKSGLISFREKADLFRFNQINLG